MVMVRPRCWSEKDSGGVAEHGTGQPVFKGLPPQQMLGPLGRHVHSPLGPSGKPAGTHQLWGNPVTCVRRAGQSYKGPADFWSGADAPVWGA